MSKVRDKIENGTNFHSTMFERQNEFTRFHFFYLSNCLNSNLQFLLQKRCFFVGWLIRWKCNVNEVVLLISFRVYLKKTKPQYGRSCVYVDVMCVVLNYLERSNKFYVRIYIFICLICSYCCLNTYLKIEKIKF